MSAGTGQLSVNFISNSAAGISYAESCNAIAITRASDLQAENNGSTSATPNTITAVALGAVPAGSCWCFITNTSTTAGQNIDLMWDDSGTKRMVETILPGCTGGGLIAGTPYVRCPSAASVPYDGLVAAL